MAPRLRALRALNRSMTRLNSLRRGSETPDLTCAFTPHDRESSAGGSPAARRPQCNRYHRSRVRSILQASARTGAEVVAVSLEVNPGRRDVAGEPARPCASARYPDRPGSGAPGLPELARLGSQLDDCSQSVGSSRLSFGPGHIADRLRAAPVRPQAERAAYSSLVHLDCACYTPRSRVIRPCAAARWALCGDVAHFAALRSVSGRSSGSPQLETALASGIRL